MLNRAEHKLPKNLGIRTDMEVLRSLWDWNGLKVADVGCGPGHLSRELAGLGAVVHAFEPDVVQAEKNEAKPEPNVTFQNAPAQALPLAEGSVDVVLLSRSLHHVPEEFMGLALQMAHKALADGGRLVVLEPDIHGQFSQMIRPFHDETVVRSLALDAMNLISPRFESVEESWYTVQMMFDSFEAFRERMLNMSFNSIVAERIQGAEVYASFCAGEVPSGFRFTNPIRMRIFKK